MKMNRETRMVAGGIAGVGCFGLKMPAETPQECGEMVGQS